MKLADLDLQQYYNYELRVWYRSLFYYFKFTPSIRGVFGINDELVRDKTQTALGLVMLKRCLQEEFL